MIVTDKEGNRYYSADEAAASLGMSRSTFQRVAAGLKKFKRDRDRKVYYLVTDVDAIGATPPEMHPIEEKECAA